MGLSRLWTKPRHKVPLRRRWTVSLLFRGDPDFFELQRLRQPYLESELQSSAYSLQTNIFRTPVLYQHEIESLLQKYSARRAFRIKVFPPFLRHFYGGDGKVSGAQVCCNIVSENLVQLQRGLEYDLYAYEQDWKRYSSEMSIPLCHITPWVREAELMLKKLQLDGYTKERQLTVVGLYLAEKRLKGLAKPFQVLFEEIESQNLIADLFPEDQKDFKTEAWRSMSESRDVVADLFGGSMKDSSVEASYGIPKPVSRNAVSRNVIAGLFTSKPKISVEDPSGRKRLLATMEPLNEEEMGLEEGSHVAAGMIARTSQNPVDSGLESTSEHITLTTDSDVQAKEQSVGKWTTFRLSPEKESIAPPLEAWKRQLD